MQFQRLSKNSLRAVKNGLTWLGLIVCLFLFAGPAISLADNARNAEPVGGVAVGQEPAGAIPLNGVEQAPALPASRELMTQSTLLSSTVFLPIVKKEGPATAPPSSPADLVQRILYPASDRDAAEAIVEVFAQAGVATVSEVGLDRPAVTPTMPFSIRDIQIESLAFQTQGRASGGYMMTLAELATTLQDLGLGLPTDRDPGQVLAQVLAEVIHEAEQQPNDPVSFTPLFLQAMSQAVSPEIDLTSGQTDPAEIRLGAMEAELFLLAFLRGRESYPTTAQAEVAPASLAAQDSNPCGDFEDEASQVGVYRFIKWWQYDFIDGLQETALDKVFKRVGLTKVQRAVVGHLLNVISLEITMRSMRLSLEAAPQTQHLVPALRYQDYNGWPHVKFTAKAAGLDLVERHQTLFDCLDLLGYHVAVDVADQIKEGRIDWYTKSLPKELVVISARKNNFDIANYPYAHYVGDDKQADLIADMNIEKPQFHDIGIEREQPVWLRAELDTSQAPIESLISAVLPGGLTEAILGIATSAYTKWHSPEAWASYTATWHEPATYYLTGTVVRKSKQIYPDTNWDETYSAEFSTPIRFTSDSRAVAYGGKITINYVSHWDNLGTHCDVSDHYTIDNPDHVYAGADGALIGTRLIFDRVYAGHEMQSCQLGPPPSSPHGVHMNTPYEIEFTLGEDKEIVITDDSDYQYTTTWRLRLTN